MSDALISRALSEIPVAIGVILALALVVVTARRPAVGCALFALLVPLTTGLGRGTIIPVFRPNEALLMMLIAGIILYRLRRPEPRALSFLDVAVGSFALGTVVIAALVLFVSSPAQLKDLDNLRNVLAPLQLLAIYLVFSRTDLSSRSVARILNLTMVASVIVGLVAVAQLFDLFGIRELMSSYYPPQPLPAWDHVYRPASTLGHFSSVGAFGTINFILALALATNRHPAFNKAWLSVVMVVNLAALVASLTWAPLFVLPIVIAVVVWQGRRVPPELGVALAALSLALLLAWPFVSARNDQQNLVLAGQDIGIPQTLQHRIDLWEAFFWPALSEHIWLGTGTVLPAAVPDELLGFVDNEYLREGYRAGVIGVGLLLLMLTSVAVNGWKSSASPSATRRSLGSALLALVLFFALIGMTAEYLFFGGVSQLFGMMVGLLGAAAPVTIPFRRATRAIGQPALA